MLVMLGHMTHVTVVRGGASFGEVANFRDVVDCQ